VRRLVANKQGCLEMMIFDWSYDMEN